MGATCAIYKLYNLVLVTETEQKIN